MHSSGKHPCAPLGNSIEGKDAQKPHGVTRFRRKRWLGTLDRHRYPRFYDTNNLSLAVFFKFGPFKILFPGDLEEDGWLAMLEQPAFRAELVGTTVLVVSHHGRTNGYCQRIFDYFEPQVVVISDKSIVHSTQKPHYLYAASDQGVLVSNTNRRRRCLTTRKDGWILFKVSDDGRYTVTTECNG